MIEIKIEGKRKASSQELPKLCYTEEDIETMYMGKDSEARKRLQRSGSSSRGRPFSCGRSGSFKSERSLSWGSQYGSSRPRYEGRDSSTKRDQSLTREKNPLDYDFP